MAGVSLENPCLSCPGAQDFFAELRRALATDQEQRADTGQTGDTLSPHQRLIVRAGASALTVVTKTCTVNETAATCPPTSVQTLKSATKELRQLNAKYLTPVG